MRKRIVLLSDGTGNVGGTTPDSNVYKVYKALVRHDPTDPQIALYDIGVGTSKNRYWRGLSGGVGFGFKRNVCDLYRYLARNYEPGDDVFVLGFSRGAATARALCGFVASAGLVDGRELTRDQLARRVKGAFRQYRSNKGKPVAVDAPAPPGSHGAIPIKFVGVWDTVAALGFPRNWRLPGVGIWVLNTLFKALDYGFEPIFPHRFYNYELTPNIENAYQAIAVDDERASFWPLVWDEASIPNTNVEQVWFPGAHSNVGGGYGRIGLACISLDWMMVRAERHGLELQRTERQEARERADFSGRLYDSRAGGALFFRYTPRDIATIWDESNRSSDAANKPPVRVHQSVVDRMRLRATDYTPGNLPYEFDIVETPLDAPAKRVTAAKSREAWDEIAKRFRRFVGLRKWLYVLFLEGVLITVGFAIYFWRTDPTPDEAVTRMVDPIPWIGGALEQLAALFLWLTPRMFERLIEIGFLERPIILLIVVLFFGSLAVLRGKVKRRIENAAEVARDTLLASVDAERA